MQNHILFTGITPEELSKLIAHEVKEELSKFEIHKEHIPVPNEGYLTQKEASDFLKCSIVKLWRLRREGFLKSHKLGRNILYKQSELTNFLEGKGGLGND